MQVVSDGKPNTNACTARGWVGLEPPILQPHYPPVPGRVHGGGWSPQSACNLTIHQFPAGYMVVLPSMADVERVLSGSRVHYVEISITGLLAYWEIATTEAVLFQPRWIERLHANTANRADVVEFRLRA